MQLLYFGSLFVVSLVASITAFEPVPGTVQRNSEGYALALLVPLFWEIATSRPAGETSSRLRTDFAVVSIGLLATQPTIHQSLGLDLPRGFVTLGEAFLAALVVSAYLLWSRRLRTAGGAHSLESVKPAGRRLWYHTAVAVILLFSYQPSARDILGDAVVDWLQRNDEAMVAMIVIPAYFDLAVYRSRIREVSWIGVMTVLPIAIKAGLLDTNRLAGWSEPVNETFIATVLIAAYFGWIRDRKWSSERSKSRERPLGGSTRLSRTRSGR